MSENEKIITNIVEMIHALINKHDTAINTINRLIRLQNVIKEVWLDEYNKTK